MKGLYDPTGCLRERRRKQNEAARVINAVIGFAICAALVGGAWALTYFFPTHP